MLMLDRPMRAAPDKFDLALTLTADPDGDMDDLSFPLDVGSITVRVTFKESDTGFDEAFTASMAIFEIRPAQCTLLFPYAAVLPGMEWNTGISVMNPGYTEGGVAGGLELTFYGNDGTEATFSTEMYPTVGAGLDEMGLVPAGGTYSVLAARSSPLQTGERASWATSTSLPITRIATEWDG